MKNEAFGSVFCDAPDGLILKIGIFTSAIYADDCLFEDPKPSDFEILIIT